MIDFKKYFKTDGEVSIKRSINDCKKYRFIKLENGLNVLLVHTAEDEIKKLKKDIEFRNTNFLDDKKSKKRKLENFEKEDDSNSNSSFDEEIEKLCAMSCCVKVGSFNDPENLQGLCHFTEHVILLGNKEYPGVNDFDEFINMHDGSSNGCTESEYTLYEAQLSNQYLEGCLKRFAACFKNPFFRQENIDAEINPLNNEFVDNFAFDDTRLKHFISSLAKKNHDFSKFCWGNYKSLYEIPKEKNINVRQEMINFFKHYYKANNMSLVVQSQETLDTLENLVKLYFHDLPTDDKICKKSESLLKKEILNTENLFENIFDKNFPFDKEVFDYIYYINPIEDGHFLKIFYVFPPLLKYHKDHVLYLLGNILGHEGNNTLISLLRKKKLALEILAGTNNSCDFSLNNYHSIFSIDIKLTDEGLERIDDVVQYFNYYIDMMYCLGIKKEFFYEELLIELNKIRFVDETIPLKNVVELAKNLFIYPIEDIIIGPKFVTEYDEKLIKNCLKFLRYESKLFIITSKQAFKNCKSDKLTDKWCNLEYKKIKCNKENWYNFKEIEENAKNYLNLPEPNEFIATDFTIKNDPIVLNEPILLDESSCYKFFYKNDKKFLTPKACVFILFESNCFKEDLKKAVCLSLYHNYLMLYINEYVYAATTANLKYSIKTFRGNLKIEISGFNHKLFKLVQVIMNKLIFESIDEDLLINAKTDLLRSFYNDIVDNNNLVEDIVSSTILHGFYTTVECRKVLKDIKLNDVVESIKYFFKTSFLKCFILGNYTREEAKEIFTFIKNKVSFLPELIEYNKLKTKIRQIPIGNNHIFVKAFNESDENIVIFNYYQIGPSKLKDYVFLLLLNLEINDPLFNLLRNQETLAYSLFFNSYFEGDVLAYSILIKSLANKFTPIYIDERIEEFLKKFRSDYIENLTLEKFKILVESKIKMINIPHLNIKQEAKYYWQEIILSKYRFDISKQKTKILQQIEFEEFKKWSLDLLSNIRIRRKLSVCSIGNGLKSKNCFQLVEPFSENENINNDDITFSLTYMKPIDKLKLFQTITNIEKFNLTNKLY